MSHAALTAPKERGLALLRQRIRDANIPPSKPGETMNLATWNIREFGRRPRLPSALRFIAEIIRPFDLVAIVELRDDLRQLHQVLAHLGPSWDAIYSDPLTDPGGNHERLGFVFDRRVVTFTGLASDAEPPRKKTPSGEYLPVLDWWRPPYVASFRSGRFDFVLLAAHVRWAGQGEDGRLGEMKLLADWVAKRARERFTDDKDLLVVGDFNIPSTTGPMWKAITAKGLRMPAALAGVHGSDLAEGKRYDQILHLPVSAKAFTNRGGVLDFYRGDGGGLFPGRGLSKLGFTFQVSDHLPLWVQVRTA